ncbi:WD40-repeat-containing domain protein [Powellomyces hirtus]|nr:WD40-repeat-containing domain protein [Powellomyces hirtus]
MSSKKTSSKQPDADAWLDAELSKLNRDSERPKTSSKSKKSRDKSADDGLKALRNSSTHLALDPSRKGAADVLISRKAAQGSPLRPQKGTSGKEASRSGHTTKAVAEQRHAESERRPRSSGQNEPVDTENAVKGALSSAISQKGDGNLRWGSVEIPPPASAIATEQPHEEIYNEEGNDYDDYAEDFEDYAEDFEDFEEFHEEEPPRQEEPDHEEDMVAHEITICPPPKAQQPLDDITEVQKALQAENQRASSRQEQRAKEDHEHHTGRPERVSSALPQRRFVGLDSARKDAQRAKKLSALGKRQAQRAADLSNIIALDVCYYDLFDLHPMNEYELYIRNYGSSNAIQAYTQCNEDRGDEETQTDIWATDNKWVQAPPEQFVDVGSGNPLTQTSSSRKAGVAVETDAKVDLLKLSSFLRRAGQVMDTLLEENAATMGVPRTFTSSTTISISQGRTSLKQQPFLLGRRIQDVCYSHTDHRIILIAYSSVVDDHAKTGLGLEEGGVLCLWRLTDPTTPYRIMACESVPTSCCFATTKHSLVFAGTASGSILAWDLQESSTLHEKLAVGEDEVVVRYPSYSTEGIYTMNGTHEEPIRSIVALPHAHESKETVNSFVFSSLGAEAGSFQVASIDEAGAMQLWTVLELLDSSFATAELDYGMGIGSRIKLIRSTALKVTADHRKHDASAINVLDCKFHPSDIDRFVVATDSGAILSESRFRNRCHPRKYCMDESTIAGNDGVLSLDFCPHDHRLFLAGYVSGAVCLFTTKEDNAVVVWEASKYPIKQVRWSPQRPAVFYVLDVRGVLMIWDLSESESEVAHVVTHESTNKASPKPLVTFALSQTGSSAASTTASQANLEAAANRNATILFGFADGTSEVHLLDQTLAEAAIDEGTTLSRYVDGVGIKSDGLMASFSDDTSD